MLAADVKKLRREIRSCNGKARPQCWISSYIILKFFHCKSRFVDAVNTSEAGGFSHIAGQNLKIPQHFLELLFLFLLVKDFLPVTAKLLQYNISRVYRVWKLGFFKITTTPFDLTYLKSLDYILNLQTFSINLSHFC